MRFRVWGSGFGGLGLGFRVWGFEGSTRTKGPRITVSLRVLKYARSYTTLGQSSKRRVFSS